MTDRELLEMAAKAAAYEVVGIAHRYIAQGVGEDDLLIANDQGGDSVWNPLTDDGDALRLAVKLYLWEAVRLAHREVSDGVDIYAATRRAIVRAAAEIGKAMA